MQNSEPYSTCPYVKKGRCPLWEVDCESFGVLYDSRCKQMGMDLRQLDQKDMRMNPLEYRELKV